MTTDGEPLPLLLKPALAPVRPRVAHALMTFATLIHWAEPELRGLDALVRPGDEVFDVGAANGMYTIPFAALVGPRGRVHSCEPHPLRQRQLRALRAALGVRQVRLKDAAVGSEPGDFTMRVPYRFVFPIYGHAHIARGAQIDPTVRTRSWTTPVHTIDGIVESDAIASVSFIKVDVEGFEPHVIEGAAATIDRDRPSLLLEIEDRHLARYGRDGDGFVSGLLERWPEYRMHTWVDETWVPADRVVLGTRNYLFATDAAFARAVTPRQTDPRHQP